MKLMPSDEAKRIIVYGIDNGFSVYKIDDNMCNVYFRKYNGKEYTIAELERYDDETNTEISWYYDLDVHTDKNKSKEDVLDRDGVYLKFPFYAIAVYTSSNIGNLRYNFEGYLTKPYIVSGEEYLGTARHISNYEEHIDSALNYIKQYKTEKAAQRFCDTYMNRSCIYELRPVYIQCEGDLCNRSGNID